MLCHQILLGSGLSDIYEIGPIYRAENPSSRRRLAEFTILDVGMAFADLADLIDVVEGAIGAMCAALRDLRAETEVSDGAGPFPRVAYSCVLEEIGLRATTGAQLPAVARRFLAGQRLAQHQPPTRS